LMLKNIPIVVGLTLLKTSNGQGQEF
jgi:hypothetical protein